MIIRRLEDADFNAFNSTFRASLEEYLQFLKDRDSEEYSRHLRERREADPSSFHYFTRTGSSFVAEQDGRAVEFVLGQVLPSVDSSKELTIEYIVVQTQFRRQRIALTLLGRLPDRAKELRIDRVVATINPNNEPSIRLHAKAGFEVLDWKIAWRKTT
jgi:RimJ/RimL family protein N-acetyltransferase